MKRRYYTGKDVTKALSIEELRRTAHRYLPGFALEYLEGGAEGELSLAWDREVSERIRFRPHTLVDTSARSTRTKLWEVERPTPLIVAPTGHNGLLRRNGDTMLARAAGSMNIPYTLSTLSNTRLERLAKDAPGPLWMQLYVFKDFDLTRDILKRAEAAGYEALVFTSDTNVHGWREWDRRQFREPGRLKRRVGLEAFLHPRWLFDVVIPHGVPRLENVVDFFPANARDTRSAFIHVPKLFTPTINWDSVSRLRELWPRKLLVKGILRANDAKLAGNHGCDGIVVSNHGARHVDSCVTPMQVLPEIAAAVGDRMPIIVDGGFRRGSDVLKAIALGADAVMLGRAALYGLAAGGEAGVRHALGLLQSEIDRVLGQLGCTSLADLSADYLLWDPAPCRA